MDVLTIQIGVVVPHSNSKNLQKTCWMDSVKIGSLKPVHSLTYILIHSKKGKSLREKEEDAASEI